MGAKNREARRCQRAAQDMDKEACLFQPRDGILYNLLGRGPLGYVRGALEVVLVSRHAGGPKRNPRRDINPGWPPHI
ncbi:hypothetical protein GQ53DRAFT_96665 [Thozetella sp. PMI_491]|nr:hypothetical protein GQ53DRAFT_96665 [Thozetella sp. PMI_491]